MNVRHGDVILIKVNQIPTEATELPKDNDKVVLAYGEVTGHSHQIIAGVAAMFGYNEKRYLKVQSDLATLSHEEHKALQLPIGDYEVILQREYDDESEWRNVCD